ncbi:ArdC family protein [Campylobacter helveticus]|uniref:ArdC family protein n=1 Tax=Campylobacter helveticus TaxID=28898 RepID=UPI00214A48B0|nr:ArdC family protein [Campylobacter helveticus]MCR2062496.1 ArdC family protein [Campylobacter helveticus]
MAKKVEKVVEQEQVAPALKWDEMTNAQKNESVLRSYSAKIGLLNKIAREENKPELAFWNRDTSLEELDRTAPYNPATGKVYENTTAVILRAEKALKGYEGDTFLTMEEANKMGATLKKELDKNGKEILTANGKTAYVKGVKIPYIEKGEWVIQKDKFGNAIQVQSKDKDGNLKFDDMGKPIMRDVKQFIPHKEPIIETTTLYHSSQFNNLDPNKFKEKDLNKVYAKREYFTKNPEALNKPEMVNSLTVNSKIVEKLNKFVKAFKSGINYENIKENFKNLDMSAKKQVSMSM